MPIIGTDEKKTGILVCYGLGTTQIILFEIIEILEFMVSKCNEIFEFNSFCNFIPRVLRSYLPLQKKKEKRKNKINKNPREDDGWSISISQVGESFD